MKFFVFKIIFKRTKESKWETGIGIGFYTADVSIILVHKPTKKRHDRLVPVKGPVWSYVVLNEQGYYPIELSDENKFYVPSK